jgi:hypothetical protein
MMSNSSSKTIALRQDEDDRGPGSVRAGEPIQIGAGPRPFPSTAKLPRIPLMIADEILDYYGWLFCQGGFRNFRMTFEQFLTVVATVSPALLHPEGDPDDAYLQPAG